jgi:hypothetical protein
MTLILGVVGAVAQEHITVANVMKASFRITEADRKM